MHLTRLRAFAAASVAVTLLSACASHTAKIVPPPTPQSSRPTFTTGTASPTTTATKPNAAPGLPTLSVVMPAVTDYLNGYNEALTTSSTAKFRKTFDQGCINCQSEAGSLDATFKKGEKYKGGQYVFSCTKVEKGIGGSLTHVLVSCSVHQQAWKVMDRQGKQVDAAAASNPLAVSVQVASKGEKFLVTGIAG
jgi:hypothetical protein